MANPTQGYCTGAVVFQIDKGHYGDLSLGGLVVAATFYFPRVIHHGEGHMQPILEAKTTQKQRDAIFYIMSGEDQPSLTDSAEVGLCAQGLPRCPA